MLLGRRQYGTTKSSIVLILFIISSMPIPAHPSSNIFLLPFLIVFIFLLLQCLDQHKCADEFSWNTI